jgi:hypothetical protein
MKNAKLKHNKIKNTGIIWELLVKQLTTDILNEKKNTPIKSLIYKYFNKNTELFKEHLIYEALLNTKFKNTSSAEKLINESINSFKKLNTKKLNTEKYNLIKELKNLYNIKKLFKSTINNYTTYASIFKLLKLTENPNLQTDVGEESLINETLVNNIINNKKSTVKKPTIKTNKNSLVNNKLMFKMLIENYNKKYKSLNKNQRNILRIFIENPINSTKLKDELIKYIDNSYNNLLESQNFIKDKAIKIKINYVLDNMLKTKMKIKNNILKKSAINNLLLFEELIEELKKLN